MALALVPKTPRRGRRTGILARKPWFLTRYPGDPGELPGIAGRGLGASCAGFDVETAAAAVDFWLPESVDMVIGPGITGTSYALTFTNYARLIGARWARSSGRGSRAGTFGPGGAGLGPASFTI